MKEFRSRSIQELNIGDREKVEFTITGENVKSFAAATGDYNPVHTDEEYASSSIFGRRVVHGVLLTGIISGILGTRLPGLGTVAREMDAKFYRPAFIGDRVTAEVELIQKKERYNLCVFKYTVTNQDGKSIVKGIAKVLPAKKAVIPEEKR